MISLNPIFRLFMFLSASFISFNLKMNSIIQQINKDIKIFLSNKVKNTLISKKVMHIVLFVSLSIKFFLIDLISLDAPTTAGLTFQDSATSVMEGIDNFHSDLMFFLVGVGTFVSFILFQLIRKFGKRRNTSRYSDDWVEHPLVEIIWTMIPTFILLTVVFPSLSLLFATEDLIKRPYGTYHITGRQWYWSYEYKDVDMIVNEREDFLFNAAYSHALLDFFRSKGKTFELEDMEDYYDHPVLNTWLKEPLFKHLTDLRAVVEGKASLITLLNDYKEARGDARDDSNPFSLPGVKLIYYKYVGYGFDEEGNSGLERIKTYTYAERQDDPSLPAYLDLGPLEGVNARQFVLRGNKYGSESVIQNYDDHTETYIYSFDLNCSTIEYFVRGILFDHCVETTAVQKNFVEMGEGRANNDPSFKSELVLVSDSFSLYEFSHILAEKLQKFFTVPEVFKYDSYMIPAKNLLMGELRNLAVDKPLVLPAYFPLKFLITSSDVIHAWALPSAGIKVDACPGRLNQCFVRFKRPGYFFGQCSEICGINHAFMPIQVVVLEPETYFTEMSYIIYQLLLKNSLPNFFFRRNGLPTAE